MDITTHNYTQIYRIIEKYYQKYSSNKQRKKLSYDKKITNRLYKLKKNYYTLFTL